MTEPLHYPSVGDILELNMEIETMFDAAEGEETEAIAAKLATLHGDLTMKLGRLHRAHGSYTARAEALRQRAQSMQALAKQAVTKAGTCERAARVILQGVQRKKWELPEGEVRLGRYRVEQHGTADIDSLDPLFVNTAHYSRSKPVLSAIGKALESGKTVPGFVRVLGVSFR